MQFDLILSKIICKISKLEVTSNHNSAVVRGMCQDKQIITSIKHLIFHRQRFQKFLEYFFLYFPLNNFLLSRKKKIKLDYVENLNKVNSS